MGRKMINITGKTFGCLTVLGPATRPKSVKNAHQYWACRCECGVEKVISGDNLRSGNTKSCGCLRNEIAHQQGKETFTKHGLSSTRLYEIYKKMKRRCYSQKDKYYTMYGGRGISICPEWLNKENGFVSFYTWSMSHGYSDDLTIDRINPNGDYSESNCRWVDASIQNFNKRIFKNNTSGYTGVRKRYNEKYEVRISKNGKTYQVGTFSTLEKAVEARERAEREFYPKLFEEEN